MLIKEDICWCNVLTAAAVIWAVLKGYMHTVLEVYMHTECVRSVR